MCTNVYFCFILPTILFFKDLTNKAVIPNLHLSTALTSVLDHVTICMAWDVKNAEKFIKRALKRLNSSV